MSRGNYALRRTRSGRHSQRGVHRARLALFLGVAMTGTARPVFAQSGPCASGSQEACNGDLDDLDLSELISKPIVTASLGEETSAAVAPASVVVVDSTDIARHGWRSLAEILSGVPGLYVVDDLVMPSIGVRGLTGGLRAGTRIVRVMINGVEVNFRPDLTAFTGPEYIPVAAIDRVEIAKGPLSALYGANAFLATVNVITREAPESLHAEVSGGASYLGGSGYGKSALVSYGSRSWQLLAAFSDETTDRSGLHVDKTFQAQDPTLPMFQPFFGRTSINDVAAPSSAYVGAKYTSDRLGTFSAQWGMQMLDAMGEFQLNSMFTARSRTSVLNDWAAGRYEKRVTDQLSMWVSGGWAHGAPTRDDRLELTDNRRSTFTRNFDYTAIDVSAGFTVRPIEHVRFTVGADALSDRETILYYTEMHNDVPAGGALSPGAKVDIIDVDERRNVALSNKGAHAEVAIDPLPRLHLFGDVRLDLPSAFDAQYSWRASAAYEWTKDIVSKLIAGRAFQTPSAVMLYGLPGFGSTNNVIGNLTQQAVRPLVPQTVESAEAVLSARLQGNIAVEVGAYAQRINDEIGFARSSNNFVAQNLEKRESLGFELMVRGNYKWLSGFVGGTQQWYLVADPVTNRSSLTDNPAPSYPSRTVLTGLNAAVPAAHLNANVSMRWIGERGATQANVVLNNDVPYQLPSYVTFDVAVSSMALFVLSETAETRLTARVRNLFDEHHLEPGYGGADIPMLGRSFFFELRQVF